jgi:ankyrin repeat protein
VPSREELNRFNARAQALGEAAGRGDLPAMAALLGEEPALATHARPFSDACKAGQAGAVRLLIQAGVDVNTTAGSGPSGSQKPLLWAIRPVAWTTGHREVLELLLDHGADPNGGPDGEFVTPLLAAAEWNHPEAISLLIERGARIGFYEAVAIADRARVDEFLGRSPELASAVRHCGVGYYVNPGTSLHFAALSRLGKDEPTVAEHLADIAEVLIAHGAPAVTATIGDTLVPGPLDNAARSGNTAVARILLRHGADPRDALVPALGANELGILDLLPTDSLELDQVGDPKLGNTLLEDQVRYGRLACAEWLLTHGASARGSDNRGWTALHYAASRGVSAEFADLLVHHGAEVNRRDTAGATPLDLARQGKKPHLVELLESLQAV